MIEDPIFYLAAIPAVVLVGMAKGGFGGSMAILAVPIMSLAISPVTAAAILLPLLLVMDAVGLYKYRRDFDVGLLKIMLPATTVGVAIGYFTASYVNESMVRGLLGVMAVSFALDHFLRPKSDVVSQPSLIKGSICGTIAGLTSFISHSGGPPYQIYSVPLRLNKIVFVGSSIIIFAYINAIKLVPYFLLGQFSSANLTTSAMLFPLAAVSVLIGAWLVKRIPQDHFYRLVFITIFIVGCKLIWDGAVTFLAA